MRTSSLLSLFRNVALVSLLLATLVTGCQTASKPSALPAAAKHTEVIELREGDTVKVTFPGAPTLNTTQPVRRDGKIVMPLTGELSVVGLTPAKVEEEILKLYAAQLVTKQVSVTVESSTFPVYVTGATIRPGKILSDHPITVLEAIMEAGGFDYAKANLTKVTVIRTKGNTTQNFTVNLKDVLAGKPVKPFYLSPLDIVYVPEKFSWF